MAFHHEPVTIQHVPLDKRDDYSWSLHVSPMLDGGPRSTCVSWDPRERALYLFLSPHRAGRSVNVKVITWGTGWTASRSSCPLTAAYRTTGSATLMPTVPTCTSRVSVARGCCPKATQAWGRGSVQEQKKKKFLSIIFNLIFKF